MENDNIVHVFRSQDDVLIDAINAAEHEARKWEAVCKDEGHHDWDGTICDRCGIYQEETNDD